MRRRGTAPIWLMGLTNAVFGMYGGVVSIAVPALLSARHVPESSIATMTAAMVSPGFWSFIASPVLDVRFSRRWYSVVTALVAAVLMIVAFDNLDHLAWVEGLLVLGFFFANLYQSALGGWLSSIATHEEEKRLSSWVTVSTIGGGGVMAVAAGAVVSHFTPLVAAWVLGGAILLPLAVFPFMPAPGPDRRLMRESFGEFFNHAFRLLRRREVLIGIMLFVAPAATFSLTNLLGGVGPDFGATSDFVGLVGGAGVALGGIAGGLAFRLVEKLLPIRLLYLATGVVGAAFTAALIFLPRTPVVFALAFIGENFFQGLSIAISLAITFEAIGRANPLAATTFCLLTSSFNIPNSYMLMVDGWGYGRRGVAGSLATDAIVSCIASAALLALLVWLARGPRRPVRATMR